MRGFRLNGWQRIGIILSVIRLLAGTVWGLKELYRPQHELYRMCLKAAFSPGSTLDPGKCNDDLEKGLALADTQRVAYVATFGLAPIFIAWLLVYIVVWTVRWVRRGFQSAH